MTTHTKGHRFQIAITQLSQLLMIPFGVTRSRAYAQVQEGALRIRFGPMFDERVPLQNIKSAEVTKWPRWAGVGPRTNFRGTVGLVGSYGDVVRLTLKEPLSVHLFVVPVRCSRLYLSLDHPEAFLKEIGKAPAHHAAKAA
jgi:hypothetical protein